MEHFLSSRGKATFAALVLLLCIFFVPLRGTAQLGVPAYREPGARLLTPKLATVRQSLARQSEYSSKRAIQRRARLVAEGLRLAPNDSDIRYYAAWLAIDQEQYAKAQALLAHLPATPRVQKLRDVAAKHQVSGTLNQPLAVPDFLPPPLTRKNVIQVETYPAFASDRQHPWFYNDLTYGRFTDYGSVYASVNQAIRNNQTGYQYVLSGYPKVNEHLYFFAEYAYSDSDLYPQDKATLRANVVLPDDVEIGPGGQYYLIQREELWSYTVWLSKGFGNNWVAIKPIFFKLANQNSVLYMVLNYRYYFDNPDRFLALAFGTGRTPDLLDLNAAGLILVNQTDYFVSYHFTVKDNVHLYFGGGYVRQVYPTGLVRKIPTMLYGLNFYF